mgnify:FL=1
MSFEVWANTEDAYLIIGFNLSKDCLARKIAYGAWQASREATLKEVLAGLPESKIMNFDWGHEHENSSTFGYNQCILDIRALMLAKLAQEKDETK